MGIIKTWDNLIQDAGSATASTALDLATGVAQGACSLLRKYPNGLPLLPFARGYVNEICSVFDSPLPEPDAPFTGGQCVGVRYNLTVIYDRYRTTGELLSAGNVRFLGEVYGPIVSVSIDVEPQPANPGLTGSYINYVVHDASGQQVVGKRFEGGDGLRDELQSVSISRVDGLADDCGDPEPSFPPDPVVDPNDYVTSVDINLYDSGGNVTSTTTYDIDFNDTDLSSFDFNVNVGGVDVDIDLGGINIGGGEPGEGKKRDRYLDDQLDDVKNPPPFNEDDFDKEEIPEEEELEKEFEEKIAWVVVTISQFPIEGKTILQANPSDNDYFAGYFRWTIKTDDFVASMPAEPIRKEKVVFKAPDGATGFRAHPVNGAKLSGTVYTEKVEIEPEEA